MATRKKKAAAKATKKQTPKKAAPKKAPKAKAKKAPAKKAPAKAKKAPAKKAAPKKAPAKKAAPKKAVAAKAPAKKAPARAAAPRPERSPRGAQRPAAAARRSRPTTSLPPDHENLPAPVMHGEPADKNVAVAAIKAAFDAKKQSALDTASLAAEAQRAVQEVLATAESLNAQKREVDARIQKVYRGDDESRREEE